MSSLWRNKVAKQQLTGVCGCVCACVWYPLETKQQDDCEEETEDGDGQTNLRHYLQRWVGILQAVS